MNTASTALDLAPTLSPLVRRLGQGVRDLLPHIARTGFRHLQLDAALPGLRPRELDQRARKDLLATLGRSGLQPAGLDLFIPRKHYLEAEHVDQAMAATLAAVELAADLGRLPLSLAMPLKPEARALLDAVVAAADSRDVRLALHAEDHWDDLLAWVKAQDLRCVGLGLDPAACLVLGHDPVQRVHQAGSNLASARLSDLMQGGAEAAGLRCVPGEGDLDLTMYRLALDLPGSTRSSPVVLDLRGLADPAAGCLAALKAWHSASLR